MNDPQTFPWKCLDCGASGNFSVPQFEPIPECPEYTLVDHFAAHLYAAHTEAAPGCRSHSLRAKVPMRGTQWRGRIFGWTD